MLFVTLSTLWGQPTRVSILLKDGVFTQTSYDKNGRVIDPGASQSALPKSASGEQRLFSVNGNISLAVSSINPSCGASNGFISVIATGGVAPYTYYTAQVGVPLNAGNFPNLIAGTYIITVTDATGEVATAQVTLVSTTIPPSLAASVVPPSTCAAMDGIITLTATGGTPPYQYSVDLQNFQNSNVFTLPLGLYNFFVRDANGCYGYFNGFNLAIQMTPADCHDSYGVSYSAFSCGNNGNITASGGGVNAPYTYSLDGINYQSNNNFENLAPGVHVVYFKNVLGEVRVFGINIIYSCPLSYNEVTVDANCNQQDGSITINAYRGTPPYTYSIDGTNFQASNIFSNLAPGYYYTTVKDAAGETASYILFVDEHCPLLSLSSTVESCALGNGTITATASNGTSPYQYSLDGVNFQNSNIFTGLSAGNYTVTTKDAMGNTATSSITVASGCLALIVSSTNTTCSLQNGSITIAASGGVPPYRYSLDGINFQTGNVFSNLPAGAYTITVKDQSNTTDNANVTLTDAPGPVVNLVSQSPSCIGNDGSITITGTGGTAPLFYSIDGTTFSANNVFTGMTPGNYQVTVKDANSCIDDIPVVLTIDCPTIVATTTNETCASSNGTITISASNGVPPYQYSIDGLNFQPIPTFSNLPSGLYTITVKDFPGYTNSITVSVEGSCPTVTATVTSSTCGNMNGSISAIGSNGVPPYQFSIDGVNFQNSPLFSNLSPGNYYVTVKDAINTYSATNVNVDDIPGPQISVVSTNASCLNNDGSITISGNGGAAPLLYSIDGNNFQNSNQFGNLASGTYTAVIKDANSCQASTVVIITLNNNLSLQTAPLTICEGDRGSLPATSNGTSFSWTPATNLDNNVILNPISSSPVTRRYYITATLGVCSMKDSVLVTVYAAPRADAGSPVSICKGQNTVLNGSGGLQYLWSPATHLSDAAVSNPVVTNPPATITYSLVVRDANNCPSLQPSTVTVTVISTLKIFVGNDTSVIINKPFQLLASDISNSGFTQFIWSPTYGLDDPNSQTPVALLDRDMSYHVTATTPSGCEATDDINIKVYKGPDIYVPSAFSPNNDGVNDLLIATPVGIKTFRYLAVFNRWGERIFYSSDPRRGWNGSVSGARQDQAVYIWVAEGIDEKGNVILRKGSVTLVR